MATLVADFRADLQAMARQHLTADWGSEVAAISDDDVLIAYFDALRRRPVVRPRKIWIADDFVCPPEYLAGWEQLQRKVTDGEDLRPHLSKGHARLAELTGTKHGDASNALLSFYRDQAKSLETSGHYFMAAVALAFAVETAVLTYLLVEFGDDNGGELKIPSTIGFYDLVDAAHEINVLSAPINVPSHIRDDSEHPKYIAKEAADKIRIFRNLIHPARALKERYDPRTFTQKKLNELWEMSESIMHSLTYYL